MQKTMRLGLVLSQREKAAVTKLAEHEGGLSEAALVRRLIRGAAIEKGFWPLPNNNKSIAINKRSYES